MEQDSCLGSLVVFRFHSNPREQTLHRSGLAKARRAGPVHRVRTATRGARLAGLFGAPRSRGRLPGRHTAAAQSPDRALGPRFREVGRLGTDRRESGSARKCLENSRFPVPGQRTPDEDRPAGANRKLREQYLSGSGDEELADRDPHRAVLGEAGVRDGGCSSPRSGPASETPGTAQAGPVPGSSSHRPSRPGPRLRVPLGGASACPPLPAALPGGRPPSRPPAAIPAAAHLRARRPPGLPTPGVRSRPAAPPPPPLAPPPRSRKPLASGPFFPPPPRPCVTSLPGTSGRARGAQVSRTRRERRLGRERAPG